MQGTQRTYIIETTQEVLRIAGFPRAHVSWGEPDTQGVGRLLIESPDDLAILIGKHGETLSAFEHLLRLALVHNSIGQDQEVAHFILDVNNYRKQQADRLLGLARTIASRVIETHCAESLSPMSSYERKLIHAELAAYGKIETCSIGQEPHRRIVIRPASQSQELQG